MTSLLYPKEPEDTQLLFTTIIRKVRKRATHFGLADDVLAEVLRRLAALEEELGMAGGV
jgi:hypothetical protein